MDYKNTRREGQLESNSVISNLDVHLSYSLGSTSVGSIRGTKQLVPEETSSWENQGEEPRSTGLRIAAAMLERPFTESCSGVMAEG